MICGRGFMNSGMDELLFKSPMVAQGLYLNMTSSFSRQSEKHLENS